MESTDTESLGLEAGKKALRTTGLHTESLWGIKERTPQGALGNVLGIGGGGAHASKGGQGARGERKPAAARPSPLGRCAVVSVGMLLHCNASDRVLCNAMGQCL